MQASNRRRYDLIDLANLLVTLAAPAIDAFRAETAGREATPSAAPSPSPGSSNDESARALNAVGTLDTNSGTAAPIDIGLAWDDRPEAESQAPELVAVPVVAMVTEQPAAIHQPPTTGQKGTARGKGPEQSPRATRRATRPRLMASAARTTSAPKWAVGDRVSAADGTGGVVARVYANGKVRVRGDGKPVNVLAGELTRAA